MHKKMNMKNELAKHFQAIFRDGNTPLDKSKNVHQSLTQFRLTVSCVSALNHRGGTLPRMTKRKTTKP